MGGRARVAEHGARRRLRRRHDADDGGSGRRRRTVTAWRVRGAELSWQRTPLLMAIVNATPDSFSDGGLYAKADAAAAHARRCVADGAALVDVGGESTRPGASRVAAIEQVARAIPVVERLSALGAAISIDTTQSSVARAALAAGAQVINDVSAGTEDPEILTVAAQASCGLVLMHRLVPPDRDRYSDAYEQAPVYGDVVREVRDWLADRAEAAQQAGVAREHIALDPGLGFGKSVAQNYELISHLPELVALGFPVVIGASRKSFVAAVTGGQPPELRVHGSIGVGIAAAMGGAAVLRVHDVAPHRQALAAWCAATRASQDRVS
ncbi:MAG: dihydropteroate synthase [Phycisphaerae bacterium]|nr:dihydropteroate synthase [Phycisphaerae bacterium]